MTEEQLKSYHHSINSLWIFMKEFLTRTDNETDPDTYWQELVDKSYQGKDKFTAKIFVAAILEIERVKKCTNES